MSNPIIVHPSTRNAFFKALMEQSARDYKRSLGTIDLEEYDPDDDTPLAAIVRNLLSRQIRTYPSLDIYFEGKQIIDLNELENLYRENVNNLQDFQSKLIFLESESNNSIAWGSVSAFYSKLGGKVNVKNEFEQEKSKLITIKVSSDKDFLNIPLNEVHDFFKEEWRKALKTQKVNLQIPGGSGVNVGIIVQSNGIDVYLIKSRIAALGFIAENATSAIKGDSDLRVRFGKVLKTQEGLFKDTLTSTAKSREFKDPEILKKENVTYTTIDQSTTPYSVTIIKNDYGPDFNIDTVISQKLQNAVNNGAILDPTAIGHTESISAKNQRYLIQVLKETLEKNIKPLLISKDTEVEALEIAKLSEAYLNSWIEMAEENLRFTRVVGRMLSYSKFPKVSAAAVYNELKNNKNLLVKNEDGTDYLGFYAIIETTTGHALQKNEAISNTIINFPLGSDVFVPMLSSNNSGIQASLEKFLKNLIVTEINKQRSPSLVTRVITKAISEIFDDDKLLNFISKYSRSNKIKGKSFIPLRKVGRLKRPKKSKRIVVPNIKITKKSTKAKKRTGQPSSIQSTKQLQQNIGGYSLIDVINSNIYNAVKMEMTGGDTLRNRTGRFAKSVKAVSVVDNRLQFTYMKRPYEVFSKESGTLPWNLLSKRDPSYIVENAIKSLISKNIISGISTVTSV